MVIHVFTIFIFFASLFNITISENYAYVSVLSSNSFLLPAQVLAHRLKKLNSKIPYIIIVTEDINEESRNTLIKQGIEIRNDTKIDTPYIKTHRARKYQYTKIKLWSMLEFDAIVHLDLDVLPVKDISTLFLCGTFCAVFRHSDMFNSGVFVLKPNETVFRDMVHKVQGLYSYDGGDQGFLNSYFVDLKLSPMFDPNHKRPMCYNFSMKTLSSAYNYDIGMYYLNNGRLLIEPTIIHYTLGMMKPWVWWTYPLFDLNWIWYEARKEMEKENSIGDESVKLAIRHVIYITILIIVKATLEFLLSKRYVSKSIGSKELTTMAHLIYLGAVVFCIQSMPTTVPPVEAWIYFSCNTAWTTSIVAAIYIRARSNIEASIFPCVGCIMLIIVGHASFWMLLVGITHFQTRCIVCGVLFFLHHMLISAFIKKQIFDKTLYQNVVYHPVPIYHHRA